MGYIWWVIGVCNMAVERDDEECGDHLRDAAHSGSSGPYILYALYISNGVQWSLTHLWTRLTKVSQIFRYMP